MANIESINNFRLFIVTIFLLTLSFEWVMTVKAPSASASTSLTSDLVFSLAASPNNEDNSRKSLNTRIMNEPPPGTRREECLAKNRKQQEKMFMAKLDAHRCLLRDTVIQLPHPKDVIVNFIQPSHVVVPRCTGLCLECPGCECQPKKKRQVKVEVIIGTNSSSTGHLCTVLKVEEHRGPCRCKCPVLNCHYNKVFDQDACLCRCKSELADEKASCSVDFERFWHEETCTCRCKERMCVNGYYQDKNTCQCRPVESKCSAIGSESHINKQYSSNEVSHVPKYIGLACVIVVALAMLLSLYYLISRRGSMATASRNSSRNGLFTDGASIPVIATTGQGSNTETMIGTLQRTSTNGRNNTAAYTITINSASSTNLDESVLPLTEDKTRF